MKKLKGKLRKGEQEIGSGNSSKSKRGFFWKCQRDKYKNRLVDSFRVQVGRCRTFSISLQDSWENIIPGSKNH